MKVAVVGCGTVGAATADLWPGALRCDLDPSRGPRSIEEAAEADFVMLCLPTPLCEGELDTRSLESCVHSLRRSAAGLVVRSTTPIGFCRRATNWHGKRLYHWPEFLTARTAAHDAAHPTHLVVGGCCERLRQLLTLRFPGVPLHELTTDESEAVKLATNAFFALKVAYFNNLHELCGKLDWARVRAAVAADPRVGASHTMVPGPDGERGFGGSCLPKDTAQFARELMLADADSALVTAALRRARW